MIFLDKIIKLLSDSQSGDINNENTYKLLLSNIAHIIALVFIMIFGILSLIKEQYIHSTILFVTSILVILNFYFLDKTKNQKASNFIIVTIITLLLIYLFTNGLNEGSGALWFFIYPIMCLFLLGLKAGSYYYVVLLIITAVIFYIPNLKIVPQTYTAEFKIRFILAFIVIYIIAYIYEYLRNRMKIDLEKAIIEAQSLSKSKSEFISRLSHQLRTPLNSILGLSSLLKNTKLDNTQNEYIETIDTSVNNIISTINEIVEVTKMDSELEKFNELSFDLNTTIKDAMLLFQKQNDAPDIKFNLAYSKFIPKKIIGSPVKVKQIFYNIIEICLLSANKNKLVFDIYANNKKETNIAIEVLFEIHTNSVDIPEDIVNQQYECDKLFQYFNERNISIDKNSRLQHSNETIKKFNLSISQEIVELYGGKIGVSRKESGIIVFWFTMLFWKTKKENILVESKSVDEKKETVKSGVIVKKKLENANVLIVEDNLINQKVLYLGLKETVNSIDLAHNGKEAVEMFSKSKYDIVLLDIQMPIMDGYKTTRKMRELELVNNIHTPIIAMTANAMDGDKERCLEEGMDEYISKPFQIEYLIKRIEFHLSESVM